MRYTVIVQEGCSRCPIIVNALRAKNLSVEVLDIDELAKVDRERRFGLHMQMLESNQPFPYIFADDILLNAHFTERLHDSQTHSNERCAEKQRPEIGRLRDG